MQDETCSKYSPNVERMLLNNMLNALVQDQLHLREVVKRLDDRLTDNENKAAVIAAKLKEME